jgi:iron complex transport system ATP-binding protein
LGNFSIKNLCFSYTESPILENINFDISSGENLGIVGPNGCGKTTLLKLLANLLKAGKGNIYFNKKDINHIKKIDLAKVIAFVPQFTEFVFSFSVFEIVLMGRTPFLKGIGFENKKDIEIAINSMLMTKVFDLKDKPINSLSGGEKQRVSLARALCQEPGVILLDEPNSHLDISYQIEMFSLLKRLNQEKGITVISVVHDLNLASLFCNRILLMKNRRILHDGSPNEVFTKENIKNVFNTSVEIDKIDRSQKVRISLLPD